MTIPVAMSQMGNPRRAKEAERAGRTDHADQDGVPPEQLGQRRNAAVEQNGQSGREGQEVDAGEDQQLVVLAVEVDEVRHGVVVVVRRQMISVISKLPATMIPATSMMAEAKAIFGPQPLTAGLDSTVRSWVTKTRSRKSASPDQPDAGPLLVDMRVVPVRHGRSRTRSRPASCPRAARTRRRSTPTPPGRSATRIGSNSNPSLVPLSPSLGTGMPTRGARTFHLAIVRLLVEK